jgi:hypothetical protein
MSVEAQSALQPYCLRSHFFMGRNSFSIITTCVSLAACGTGSSAAPGAAPTDSLGRVNIEAAPELTAACASDGGGAAWECPDVRVDCAATSPVAFRVVSADGDTCNPDELIVDHDLLTLGSHEVVVRNAGNELLCTGEVVVERSEALRLVPHDLKLWPPNHKFHDIAVSDCVDIVGACPNERLSARFIWASSDEPTDSIGDGNHQPDIVVSPNCQRVALRSERQGTSDGRVYNLGVLVVDGEGAEIETTCTVSVAHDQSGRAPHAGADAYRIELDGTADQPDCTSDNLDPQ